MKVGYEQMEAFRGQLRTKISEFEGQSNTMIQELDGLLEQWSDSDGAVAFGGVVDEIKRQISQLNENVGNTEVGLGKASASYSEHDAGVRTAFTNMVAT